MNPAVSEEKSCDRQEVLHGWRTGLVSAFSKLNAFFAEEFEAHQTIYFTNLGTQQNLGSVFLYPVFVGDSRGFVIEFNSCFVLAQEKSIERTH